MNNFQIFNTEAMPQPEVYKLSRGYNYDYWNHASLDEISLNDLLNSDQENIFILQDIHNQIISLGDILFKQSSDKQAHYLDLLENMTVAQMEFVFRYEYIEDPDLKKHLSNKYNSILESYLTPVLSVYGWLLPYYVDYEVRGFDLNKQPPITLNLRPQSKNNYPHSFALHFTHRCLFTLQTVFNDELRDNRTAPYILAKEAKQALANQKQTKIKKLYLKHKSDFKNKGLKSAAKRTDFLDKHYNHKNLGYEYNSFYKLICKFQKEHG